MVVACLALTVALSGASYAAVVLPRNSVGKAQLKRNAVVSAKIAAGGVRTGDLGAGAVNSRKVKNRSLLKADFKAGQLPPSFANGKQIANVNDIPCNVEVVVGSQTLTVTDPHASGSTPMGRFARAALPRLSLGSGSGSAMVLTQRPWPSPQLHGMRRPPLETPTQSFRFLRVASLCQAPTPRSELLRSWLLPAPTPCSSLRKR
jgi:hypothetical protein